MGVYAIVIVVVISLVLMNSCDTFTHYAQGLFTGIGRNSYDYWQSIVEGMDKIDNQGPHMLTWINNHMPSKM